MADFLKILEQKIDFTPSEQGVAERWFRQVERDNLFANAISSSGGGGGVTELQAGNVNINLSEGITLRNPITGDRTIYLDPDGDAFFGSNIDNPAKTALSVFSNENTYNTELFGAGDLLLGDNTTGKANLFWDASAGKLYFRSGTTVSVEIGDGGIVASWGSIGGWSIDATRIYKSQIELDSAADAIRVGTNKVVLDTSGITAIQGTIAGWTIDADEIKKTGIKLNSANDQIEVGAGVLLDGASQTIQVGASAPTIDIDGSAKVVQSSNFSSGASGFQLSAVDGDAEFNNIVARGSFRTSVFTYENILAIGGDLLLSKGSSEVVEDVVTASPFTLKVKPADDGTTPRFEVGDVLRIKGWNATELIYIWGTVTAASTAGGVTTLTDVTLESGGTGKNIQKGMAVVNYGPSGAGILHLQAGETTTRMRIAQHAGSPWTAQTNMVVIGNMRGTYDTGANDRYGVGIGDFSSGNYLSYNAKNADEFVLKAGDAAVTINGDGITITEGDLSPNIIQWVKSDETFVAEIFGQDMLTDHRLWLRASDTAGAAAIFIDAVGSTNGTVYISGTGTSGAFNALRVQKDSIAMFGEYGVSRASLTIDGGLVVGDVDLVSTPNEDAIQFYLGTTLMGEMGASSASPSGSLKINHITNKPIYTPRHIRADAGLTTSSRVPDNAGDIVAGNDIRVQGGVWIGKTTSDPAADTLKVDGHGYYGGGITIGYVAGAAHSDGINFYYGTSHVGDITVDSAWMRINQTGTRDIYTPRMFRAAVGLVAGGGTVTGGDVMYDGQLRSRKSSVNHTVYAFKPLTTPIRVISFTGASAGTGTTTMSGLPANIKAIAVRVAFRNTAVGSMDDYLSVGPTSTNPYAVMTKSIVANKYNDNSGVAPTKNGTNQIVWKRAGSAGNLDGVVDVYGYWI